MQSTVIAPSILSANFARLGEGEAGFHELPYRQFVLPNARPWMAGPGHATKDGCSQETR